MRDGFKLKFNNKTLIEVFIGLLILKSGLQFIQFLTNAGKSINQKGWDYIWSTNKDQLHIYIVQTGFEAPFLEELFFRGFIYILIFKAAKEAFSLLNKNFNTKKSECIINFTFILISSILFANIHSTDSFITLLPYIYSGLILGCMYVLTKNILVTMLIHSLNNIMVFLDFSIKETYLFILVIMVFTLINQSILSLNKKYI